MIDLFLIAHKVHGAPAFDIAHHLACPECSALGCLECDDLGYWWVIGTSGHRAYPYWNVELGAGVYTTRELTVYDLCSTMPDPWPDHYPTRTEPSAPSLLSRLNLKPTPQPPIARRF